MIEAYNELNTPDSDAQWNFLNKKTSTEQKTLGTLKVQATMENTLDEKSLMYNTKARQLTTYPLKTVKR